MDKISEWFGDGAYFERLEKIMRFWRGEGRLMISVTAADSSYRQVFSDEKIRELAPLNLEAQAKLPGCNLPSFFADFGTVSTAKYWGGECFFPHDGSKDIFIHPAAKTLEEALALEPRRPDDPEMDAARGLALFRAVSEELETDKLWLRTPDFQGALNTAALVMDQTELMIAMSSEPDLLKTFLDRVTSFLIDYFSFLKRGTDGQICGNIWPYTFFPAELGASFTEDYMPLLSPEMYQEFGIPCVERMSEAFGGVHIHCCGAWGRHAAALKKSKAKIRAVEFHYPFTKFEETHCLAPDTVFIPYIKLDAQKDFASSAEYYDHLLKADSKARFWLPLGECEESLRLAQKHG